MLKEKNTLNKGIFIISLDTELAWGFFRYKEYSHLYSAWYMQRKNIKNLLKLFDRYQLPATWAIVGHLFLRKCDGKHKDIIKCDAWNKYDPGTQIKENPLFYGADIIKLIKESKTNHEIACHSFAHTNFKKCPEAVAKSELKMCKKLFKKNKIPLLTFIYPQEQFGNFEALKNAGIKTYRRKKRLKNHSNIQKFKKILSLFLTPTKKQTTYVYKNKQGLLEIPADNIVVPINKTKQIGKTHNRIELYLFKKYNELLFYKKVKTAIKNKGIVHLSTHPHNFTNTSDIYQLEKMLKYINRKRNCGTLDICTMSDVYKKYFSSEKPKNIKQVKNYEK